MTEGDGGGQICVTSFMNVPIIKVKIHSLTKTYFHLDMKLGKFDVGRN